MGSLGCTDVEFSDMVILLKKNEEDTMPLRETVSPWVNPQLRKAMAFL
jgi:hypothetical protein